MLFKLTSLIVDILPVLPQYTFISLNLGSTQVYKDFKLNIVQLDDWGQED